MMENSNNSGLPELMSMKELIEYLQCGKDRAYTLVKSKSFPSMQLGSRWYVIKDDLPDWIRRQEKKMTYAK